MGAGAKNSTQKEDEKSSFFFLSSFGNASFLSWNLFSLFIQLKFGGHYFHYYFWQSRLSFPNPRSVITRAWIFIDISLFFPFFYATHSITIPLTLQLTPQGEIAHEHRTVRKPWSHANGRSDPFHRNSALYGLAHSHFEQLFRRQKPREKDSPRFPQQERTTTTKRRKIILGFWFSLEKWANGEGKKNNKNKKNSRLCFLLTPVLTNESIIRSLRANVSPCFILMRFLSRHFMAYILPVSAFRQP